MVPRSTNYCFNSISGSNIGTNDPTAFSQEENPTQSVVPILKKKNTLSTKTKQKDNGNLKINAEIETA